MGGFLSAPGERYLDVKRPAVPTGPVSARKVKPRPMSLSYEARVATVRQELYGLPAETPVRLRKKTSNLFRRA